MSPERDLSEFPHLCQVISDESSPPLDEAAKSGIQSQNYKHFIWSNKQTFENHYLQDHPVRGDVAEWWVEKIRRARYTMYLTFLQGYGASFRSIICYNTSQKWRGFESLRLQFFFAVFAAQNGWCYKDWCCGRICLGAILFATPTCRITLLVNVLNYSTTTVNAYLYR